MLHSIILQSLIRFIFFFTNIFALYLLLRGHNFPGGGFIAGIATAISLAIVAIVSGNKEMCRILKLDPLKIAAIGLCIVYGLFLAPSFLMDPALTHYMGHFHLPIFGEVHVGTPLIFDIGVYLVVVGTIGAILNFLTAEKETSLR